MHFIKYLIAIGFLTVSVETAASFSEIMEGFQKSLGSSMKLDEKLLMKGCSLIEKIDNDMVKRYDMGVSFKKNKVEGFKQETPERLVLQWLCFEGITTKDDYSRKAMHNLAETFVRLGEKISNTTGNIHLKAAFFQDAYYLFSLANFEESKNNMKTLIEDKKISFIPFLNESV